MTHRTLTATSRRGRRLAVVLAAAAVVPVGTLRAHAQPPAERPLSGLTTVEVVSLEAPLLADAVSLAASLGGSAQYTTSAVVTANIPAAVRPAFELALPDGLVRDPYPVDIPPESGPMAGSGPHVSGLARQVRADQWHRAGFDGTGVTIGVIDHLDVPRYWNVAEHGPTPTSNDVRCRANGSDCATMFFDGIDAGGENHGAAVVETLREVAPGVRLVFGRARSLQDYRDVIDWFATQGVSVVTRSLGSRYDDPGDGRGDLNEIAEYAVSRGMLWVNSGGNNADGNYVRQPVSLLPLGYVSFGGSRYLPFEGKVTLAGVRWANDWDAPLLTRTDYDVTLLRAPAGRPELGSPIALSINKQTLGAPPLELIAGTFTPGPGEQLYLTVQRVLGDITGDVIEVLDYGDGMAAGAQSRYSGATPIVTSRSAGVLAVGAIDPPGGTTIAPYSARGPSNDGRIIPAVSAPVGYVTTSYGGFAGTSAAAPVVSGIAAVLQSAGSTRDPERLGREIRSHVIDHGAAGPDSTFGAGEVRLPALEPGPTAPPPDPPPPPQPGGPGDPGVPSGGSSATRFVPTPPRRLLDTRPDSAAGPASLTGEFEPGEVRELQVGDVGPVPTGAAAAVLNVTVVGPRGPGYVQLLPTGRAEPGAFSNLNVDAVGQIRANLAIAPLGDGGRVSIHHRAGGHVLLDLVGYFVKLDGATRAGRLEQRAPERSLDTRAGPDASPLQPDEPRSVRLPASMDGAHAAAVVVNVTATNVTAAGYVQAFPTGRNDLRGQTSTVNLAVGETAANTAIVAITPGSSTIQVVAGFGGAPPPGAAADVVVDVVGYLTSDTAPAATAGRFVPVVPRRAYDSRVAPGAALTDADPVVIDASGAGVPVSASAVVWNATVVSADRPGFARAWADGTPAPPTSIMNWGAGQTRASASISAADDGRTRFLVDDGAADLHRPVAHLVADVFGYFT